MKPSNNTTSPFRISATLLAFIATTALYAGTVTENFESYTPGTTASGAGWSSLGGTGMDLWIVEDTTAAPPATYPAIPSGNGTRSFAHEATGSTGALQIRKSFGSSTGFTDTGMIYYSAWTVPYATGSNVQGLKFGAVGSGGFMIPLFGINQTASTTAANFFVSTSYTGSAPAVSTATFATNHWYELQLTIDQSTGANTPTLSLFVRDVTAGDTSFSAVEGLQSIVMTMTSSTKASTWTDWAIQGSNRQNVDNLYLSDISTIPEASTTSFITLAGACIVLLRLRRKSRGNSRET
jgi:hypothetical protein